MLIASNSISVSTVTADANGHQKGDVLIALPPPLADAVTEYIARTDSCASLKKRTISDTCFGDIAGSLMEQTVNNGWAAGLVMQPTQLPQQIPRMIAHYLPIVIAAGQKISGLARLNKIDFNGLAELVALIVYDKIIEGLKDTPTPTEYVIKASEIADASQTSASGKSSTCPPDDRIPCCPNCGGDSGNNKCNGIKAAGDAWKGCPCIGDGRPPYRPFPNDQAYKDAQALLLNLPDFSTEVAPAAATATGPAIPPQYVPIDGKYKIKIITFAGAVNGPSLVYVPVLNIDLALWHDITFG